MIKLRCAACGKAYQAPDHLAGRTTSCSCGAKLTVPNPQEPVAIELHDEFELETPPQGPHSSDAPLRVKARSAAAANSSAELLRSIETTVLQHVKGAEGAIQRLDLQLTLEEYKTDEIAARVTINCSGTVNWHNIVRQFRAVRQRHRAIHAGGVVGTLASTLVINAVTRAAGLTKGEKLLQECLRECVADICIGLDTAVGRKQSRSAQIWSIIRWARWAAAAGMLIGLPVFLKVVEPDLQLSLIFIHALIPAAALFWLVHLVGLQLMPNDFFHSDPRGRKAMARSGVKTVAGLRTLGVVSIFVLGCVFAIGLLLCIMGARDEGERHEAARKKAAENAWRHPGRVNRVNPPE